MSVTSRDGGAACEGPWLPWGTHSQLWAGPCPFLCVQGTWGSTGRLSLLLREGCRSQPGAGLPAAAKGQDTLVRAEQSEAHASARQPKHPSSR